MIGSGLSKLAKQNNMQIRHGVAYGSIHGFAASCQDGANVKIFSFPAYFADSLRASSLIREALEDPFAKQSRVQSLQYENNTFLLVFKDTIGTMKRIEAYLPHFADLLRKYQAGDASVCCACGTALDAGTSWHLVNNIPVHMHAQCAQHLSGQLADAQATTRENQKDNGGSYGKGILGALLGALIGAIPWAILLYLGYVAALAGLLMAWLSIKLYAKLGGLDGKGKLPIIILSLLLGIFVGTVLGDTCIILGMVAAGELAISFNEIPALLIWMLQSSPEFLSETIRQLGMGVLFAGLGSFYLLRQVHREGKKPEVKELN